MSMYLNCAFEDGERLAVEIGTPKGVTDFTTWAQSLPSEFDLVRTLAVKGEALGSKRLEEQLQAALKATPPKASARAVVRRLIEVVPHEGRLAISDEPDDSEMDEE